MTHGMTTLAAGIVAAALAVSGSARADTPSRTFLQPNLTVGERMTHVFSRAISIKGEGFKEYVIRISGTARDTILSIEPRGITLQEHYRYDGHAAGSGRWKILADGVTHCWKGRCSIDRDTSGIIFSPQLWGHVPGNIHVGSTWTATIAEPWELGPPGKEAVRVVGMDPARHVVTLVRRGSGDYEAGDDSAHAITITTGDGKPLQVKVKPGASRWRGRTIVRDGIIVGDTIMVTRQVTLVSASGRTFSGEERAYTLENLLQDRT